LDKFSQTRGGSRILKVGANGKCRGGHWGEGKVHSSENFQNSNCKMVRCNMQYLMLVKVILVHVLSTTQ